MKFEQVWFSSPLLMNDRQEMLHGLDLGTKFFNDDQALAKACGNEHRVSLLRENYRRFLNEFYTNHAINVFVLCLSEFGRDRPDGLLSMWRGYGSNGHGAALVFDTKLIHRRDEMPMIVSKVTYASDGERIKRLRTKFAEVRRRAVVERRNRRPARYRRLSYLQLRQNICAHNQARRFSGGMRMASSISTGAG